MSIPMDSMDTNADPEQVIRSLVRQRPGQRLPGERDLATQLKISRPYLRNLLARLHVQGIVETRAKSGTFAANNRSPGFKRITISIDRELKLNDDPFVLSVIDTLQRNIQAASAQCVVVRSNDALHEIPGEDGLLTLGLSGQALLESQETVDLPTVCLFLSSTVQPARHASVIQLDDIEAGKSAVKILASQGCGAVMYAGRQDIPASNERWLGASQAASQAAIESRFMECHLSYTAGIRMGREIGLSMPSGRWGVIATNDWLAMGIRLGLQERLMLGGPDIPIVSFDGLPATQDPLLGITSLAVPVEQIATDAVAELERLRRFPGAAGRILRYPLGLAEATE